MSDEKEIIRSNLDYTGMLCSQIRLELRDAVSKVAIGEIVRFKTDAPDALMKVEKWCRLNKQELFLSDTVDGLFVLYIKRLN
ncbi:MAG: sulfurtransferase TusA family protein [Candidatus Heimdallarchaeota archaeon]